MATHVSGEFDVKVTPQKPDNKEAETAGLGRVTPDSATGELAGLSGGLPPVRWLC
jgi:hypothetical protein